MSRDTTLITLMRMATPGPEVSLNGSPTVSPTTAALWVSERFGWPGMPPVSMSSFALSHDPPAFAMNSDMDAPTASAPARVPARDAGPSTKPMSTGPSTATQPGKIIWVSAAEVAMSTMALGSGSAVPSRRPGMVSNCRLISSTMAPAAVPTASMVEALTANGSTAPMRMPMRMRGSSSDKDIAARCASSRAWPTSRL